jgi:elongation factor Ts
MTIKIDQVKELREKTGISIMQCKKALDETGGDLEKAEIVLRKKSKEVAAKKASRDLGAGVVASYVHGNGKVGSLVELLCETDFVAKNEEFIALAKDIAMQVAATEAEFLIKDQIDEDTKAKVKEILVKEVEDKPEEMRDKILEGKLDSYFKDRVLLDQPFIKDPNVTIGSLIQGAVQKFGERTEVGRFTKFNI